MSDGRTRYYFYTLSGRPGAPRHGLLLARTGDALDPPRPGCLGHR